MKLRVQLILAFFLLAVVPLTAVSIYSYNSSLRAVRQTAQAESEALAAEMGDRMESATRDLNRRIQRLGGFPFRSLMGGGPGNPEVASRDALVNQLMAQIGDSAPFVKSLEFIPSQPPPPAPPDGFSGHPRQPKPPNSDVQAGGLVIHMPGSSGGPRGDVPGDRRGPDPSRTMMHIEIPGNGADPKVVPPVRLGQDQVRKLTEIEIQNIEKQAEVLKRAAMSSANSETALKVIEASRKELESSLGRAISTDVRREGELVGQVRAQVSTHQMLRQVISRTQRKKGEIPFAMDTEGKIYAADPTDQPKLDSIPMLKNVSTADSGQISQVQKNWVVVTRKDPSSGVTMGIARPIADRMDEIRRTAAMNLLLGLGLVCLAGIGILPLSARLTRNLTALTHGAEELASGNLQARVVVRSRNEIGKLAQAFNQMAQDLSEKQKHLLEQERMKGELEMCRKIQVELLPRQSLRTGIAEVKGISIPAREVGGDFFNYFPLPNGDLALLVGDVSGKGLPAALLMANLQATIQAQLPLELDLAKLADNLDHQIASATPAELYLTLFISILETETRILRYVNAGHNFPFALLSEGSVVRLESTGRPLGLLPGGGYVEKRIQLKQGDSLFFYTDGLVETENEAGEELGMTQVEKVLIEDRRLGLDGIMARIEKLARDHRGNKEAADDATMVLVRIGDIVAGIH